MRRFTVLLYQEEGGYSVLVPSLPGCVTQGDTVEEALANAREAIEGHVAVMLERGEEVLDEPIPPSVVTIEIPIAEEAPAAR